jgi:type I restriction enzyme, S subunit
MNAFVPKLPLRWGIAPIQTVATYNTTTIDNLVAELDTSMLMKDSGVEWIGAVPENWRVVRLKNCAYVEMGQSPSSSDCNDIGNGEPFLQGCADFGKRNPTASIYCACAPKFAETNDILFSVRAPVGRINLADQLYGIGRGLCAIRASDAEQRFVSWAVMGVGSQLDAVATGSTYEAVSVEDVRRMVVALPQTVNEQRAIADFLDRETFKIDELVAEQERLIVLIKEKQQALILHVVTKGLDPSVTMKDSGVECIGHIPSHWKRCKINHEFNVTLGKMVTSDISVTCGKVAPYLRAASVQDGWINLDNIKEMWLSDKEVEFLDLRIGDLVVCEGGDVGRCALLKEDLQGYGFQNSIHRIRPFEKSSTGYLKYWLNNLKSGGYIDIICNRATIAHLTVEKLNNLQMPLPNEDEQKHIVKFLDEETKKIDSLLHECERCIDLLKERRYALILAAVTGKIDIRNHVSRSKLQNEEVVGSLI